MGLKIRVSLVLGLSLLLKFSIAASEHNWVPTYHLAPEKGWMNDPNGLSYFDGYYHAFYQHNPDDTVWGPMHWGHARSKDMLDWEHLPIALTPSLPEDTDGVFSGSAVINNGNLTLIYTGVSGNGDHQMQCLATSSDGLSFVKEGAVLRRDGDDQDFRDPKVWWQDGSWFMVVGTKVLVDGEFRGKLLLYNSPDLYNWESQGVLAQANEKQGKMWECPDLFTLGDKQIIVVSPQGIDEDGYDYQNLYQTGYLVGTWSPDEEYQIEKQFREIDHGHDFYASATFLAPDGRRILIGWLDMWMSIFPSVFPESAEGWAGMLTLPRELTLSPSGDLEVRPIREIKERRNQTTATKKSPFVINRTITFGDDVSRSEIVVSFNLSEDTSDYFGIRIGDDNSEPLSDEGVEIIIKSTEGRRLFLQRYYPQYDIPLSNRSVALNTSDTELTLDIFVDSSSIEVFVNDGKAVLSSRIYPNEGERLLTFFMAGGTLEILKYEIWHL